MSAMDIHRNEADTVDSSECRSNSVILVYIRPPSHNQLSFSLHS